MPILSLTNIKKSYITDEIIEDASFIVEEKDKIGLIGLNGSGKTTLLKIITEEISKDFGTIFKKKDLKIGYLKQQLNLDLYGTIYENCIRKFSHIIEMEKNLRALEEEMADKNGEDLDKLMKKYSSLQEKFLENDGYSYNSKIRGALIGLGFSEEDFSKDISTLSGGEKARVGLAMLLLEESDLILLDEPTNHLDISSVSWLEKYLKEYKGAVIVISHDRYFLNSLVNKIVLLENKKTTNYTGSYDTFIKKRKKDLEILEKQYENQQKEIKRQKEIIEKFMSMGKERLIRQGQSRKKLLEKMEKIEAPKDTKRQTIRFSPSVESGREVLKVSGLKKSFNNHIIFKDVNFQIYKKDKIGLIGPNGVGKSTLFKIITGEIKSDEGEINFGTNVNIAYFDQEMDNLKLNNTIIDEIWDSYPLLSHYEIRSYLAKFLFIGDDIFKEISQLSGGEKARVSLLKIMLSNANFLLLDEPTNHLDIDSKESLEDAINLYDGTILSISHDRYFLNKTTDKIFNMTPQGINIYLGNYDYFVEKTTISKNEEEEYISKTEIAKIKKEQRLRKNENKKKRLEKEKLEREIEDMEQNLSTIDEKLSSIEVLNNYEEILKLSKEREDIENKLNISYDKWILMEEE